MTSNVLVNSFWANKALYDDAEKKYYEKLAQLQKVKPPSEKCEERKAAVNLPLVNSVAVTGDDNAATKRVNKNKAGGGEASQIPLQKSSLASEVAKAREHIKASLESIGTVDLPRKQPPVATENVVGALEKALSSLQGHLDSLEKRVAALEIKCATCKPILQQESTPKQVSVKPTPSPSKGKDDDEDDVDLFGSDSEDDEKAAEIKEKRLAEYAAKKAKKPALVAKSMIIIDVKPWDDETDMKQLEEGVRAIAMDGLLWGASKLVPLAYGIHKLQISCVVEDDKVSVDLLTEQIEAIEELVQSVDIAAFNKI